MTRSMLTVAAKKVGGKWHGAVISNDAFMMSLIETDLSVLVEKALVGAFVDRPEGASVNLNVLTLPPVEKEVSAQAPQSEVA